MCSMKLHYHLLQVYQGNLELPIRDEVQCDDFQGVVEVNCDGEQTYYNMGIQIYAHHEIF